jgi:Fe-S cluster assembly protein SufB
MLRISKLADYATLILHCLAAQPTELASASDIAHKTGLQLPTVSKLLKAALRGKLVVSIRGVGGGYRLAKDPKDISLAEIITAIEGQPALTQCSEKNSHCAQDGRCAIKHNWQNINRFFLTTLANISLADMQQRLTLEEPLHKVITQNSTNSRSEDLFPRIPAT